MPRCGGGDPLDERQKQTVFDPAKVIAIGIASPVATFLTSRFGVAGTLVGLALSAMILTAVADFLKVYLARTPHVAAHAAAATKVPIRRGLLARFFRRRDRAGSMKVAHQGFSSPPPGRKRSRRSLLAGSITAAGISFVLGLGVVTAVELSAGQNLACLMWNDCPTGSPTATDEGEASSEASTLPSIFGGGKSAGGSVVPEVGHFDPAERPAPPSGAPEGSPSEAAGSGGPGSGASDDRWRNPSDRQQDAPPYPEEDRQQGSYYYYTEEHLQRGGLSSGTPEGRSNGGGGFRDGGEETTEATPGFPSVPFTT